MPRTHKQIQYEVNENNCWICTSHCKDLDGYHKIIINKKYIKLHRYMYENKYGTIPKGLCACHKCDCRSCINPDHIFLGTPLDNMIDMMNKGRFWLSIKEFKATSPKGDIYYYNNKSEFSANFKLNLRIINQCLNKERESYEGWKFEYTE